MRKSVWQRDAGCTTASKVSPGNEASSPPNTRAKLDASKEYLGGGAGLALSHGAAITLGASSSPPWSQNCDRIPRNSGTMLGFRWRCLAPRRQNGVALGLAVKWLQLAQL